MTSANYGIYGSRAYYAVLAIIASLFLVLIFFTEFARVLFITALVISIALLALLMLVPQILYARRRIGIVHEVIASGKIDPDDRVLDVGTGRGFLGVCPSNTSIERGRRLLCTSSRHDRPNTRTGS